MAKVTQKNSKFLIFTAQHNGFGPVSKMLNIASFFKGYKKYFIGQGIALDYVKNSKNDLFEEIIDSENLKKNKLVALIKSAEFVVDVMSHDLAFLSYEVGTKYFFFDSLFGFWYSRKTDVNLFKKFILLNKAGRISRYQYNCFSVHEKKMLSHFLAESSFIQNFFGVYDRFKKVKDYLPKTYMTKPFASDYVSSGVVRRKEKGLLVFNLGGIKNFINKNDKPDYLELVLEISKRLLLEKKIDITKIVICSGLYSEHGVLFEKNGKKVVHTFLKNKLFLYFIKRSKINISSAGLTSIFEFLYSGTPVIYFLEQHASQYYNLREMRKAGAGKLSISIHDIFGKVVIPKNDYRGSARINDYIKKINWDKKYFEATYKKVVDQIIKYKNGKGDFKVNKLKIKLDGGSMQLKDVIKIIINKQYE